MSDSLRLYLNEVKDGDLGDGKEAAPITCIEFDESGEYLAVGDRSGRIYVFNGVGQNLVYNLFCTFTSHDMEFDYLKSIDILAKINCISWLPIANNSLQLLSTNDKVIKLWRMSQQAPAAYNFNFRADECGEDSDESTPNGNADKSPSELSESNETPSIKKASSLASLRIPRYRKRKSPTIEVRCRKSYANVHAYHIHSLSLNSDQETFLSADDLRINVWNLNVSDQTFMVVDIKPDNMEELNHVITCARFHPERCNILGYSTSLGTVRICDLREHALCDNDYHLCADPDAVNRRGFFTDITSSISDFRFDHSGNYVLARDYLNLKVWDLRKPHKPCEVYNLHEELREKLVYLYETDAIFDKFLCSWSDDDRYVMTGTYSNLLRIFDRRMGGDALYDLGEHSDRPAAPTVLPGSVNLPFLQLTPGMPSPHRTRLCAKAFCSPSSDLGLRLELPDLSVVDLHSLDALNNHPSSSTNAPTVKASVLAGSKRRKQTLLPARDPDSPDRDREDGDAEEDDDEDEVVDAWSIRTEVSEERRLLRSLDESVRQVDFGRKFLQVAWHPQKCLLVAVNDKEMYFAGTLQDSVASPTPVNSGRLEAKTPEGPTPPHLSVEVDAVNTVELQAAKRPCRRQDGDVGTEDESSSPEECLKLSSSPLPCSEAYGEEKKEEQARAKKIGTLPSITTRMETD